MMTIREYPLEPFRQLHTLQVPLNSDFQYITTNPDRNMIILPVLESGHPDDRATMLDVSIILLRPDDSHHKDPHKVYRSLGSVIVKNWQNGMLEARVYGFLVLPI